MCTVRPIKFFNYNKSLNKTITQMTQLYFQFFGRVKSFCIGLSGTQPRRCFPSTFVSKNSHLVLLLFLLLELGRRIRQTDTVVIFNDIRLIHEKGIIQLKENLTYINVNPKKSFSK